ncbi:MAG: lactonase family protein [Deltaproteobacteria bacterium]|nr:lactonase family protein [Deltaproteobacteria bacterium]
MTATLTDATEVLCGACSTNSLYTTGVLTVIMKNGNSVYTEVNKLTTNGDATVNSITGPNGGILYFINEYSSTVDAKFTLIGPGNNWQPQVITLTKLKNVYGLVQTATHIICIDYDNARVVKVNKTGWVEEAWYDFVPEAGNQGFGVGICTLGNYVMAVFIEADNPWTTANYASSKAVVLNPGVSGATLPVVQVRVGQEFKSQINVGKNATSLIPFTDPQGKVHVFVPCIGGKQKTNEGNATESHLDEITVTANPATGQLSATVATRLVGSNDPADTTSLDIRHIAFKEDGTAAYVMVANVYAYNIETYKTQMVWKVYQTTFSNLETLTNALPSSLGTAVLSSVGYDEGFLWDIVYDNGHDWLWMGHGDSIHIYNRGVGASWTPIHVFPQVDENDPTHSLNISANADGNLNSYDVTAESLRAFMSMILRGVQPHGLSSDSPQWRAHVRREMENAKPGNKGK